MNRCSGKTVQASSNAQKWPRSSLWTKFRAKGGQCKTIELLLFPSNSIFFKKKKKLLLPKNWQIIQSFSETTPASPCMEALGKLATSSESAALSAHSAQSNQLFKPFTGHSYRKLSFKKGSIAPL
jgi:hypothetical protein